MTISNRLLITASHYQASRDYWHGKLSLLEEDVTLRPPFADPGDPPGTHRFLLAAASGTGQRMLQIAKEKPLGVFVLVLSSVCFLLHKHTERTLVRVDSPLLAGNNPGEAPAAPAQYVPLIARVNENDTLRQLIAAVKQAVSEGYAHQFFPIAELEGDLRNGKTNVLVCSPGLHVLPPPDERYDLLVAVAVQEGGIAIEVKSPTGRFGNAFTGLFGQQLAATLSYLEAADTPLSRIVLGAAPAAVPDAAVKARSIPALFEEMAARCPANLALVLENESLTYAELNEKANQLAHFLVDEYRVRPGDIIGVVSAKSVASVVSLLGILKAGGVYLPVDPAAPAARISHQLRDAAVAGLLVDSGSIGKLTEFYEVPMFALDFQLPHLETSRLNPGRPVDGGDPAYVIYTSGSTGTPKGVLVEHGGFTNMVLDQLEVLGVAPADRVAQIASLSFDASLNEIFVALLSGATLVMVPARTVQDVSAAVDYLEMHRVTVAIFTPAYLNCLPKDRLPALRTVVSAGDQAFPEDASFYAGHKTFINSYGPTEASVCIANHRAEPGRSYAQVPIGTPTRNNALLLLDPHLNPLPAGLPGEICIAGAGVARGYLNNVELTRAKFPDNPFGPGKLYRTGDLGVRLPDGTVQFLGRRDHQVKVRGFRVELGEVEQALRHASGLPRVAVTAARDGRETYLVAYLESRRPLEEEVLRNALKKALPDYMIPARFVGMESLPVTTSGKVDRKALGALQPGGAAKDRADLPMNELEKRLFRIWSRALKNEAFGPADDFFGLGGHSLSALQVVTGIRKELGVDLLLSDFFALRTIRAVARKVELLRPTRTAAIRPLEEQEYYAVSDAQRRLWVQNSFAETSNAYNIFLSQQLDGSLDREALQAAFAALVRRHEVLRTRFVLVAGELKQRVAPAEAYPFKLQYTDLRDSADPAGEAREIAAKEVNMPFDLEAGPLMRVKLFQLAGQSHALLVTFHHVVCDAQSLKTFVRQLGDYYRHYSAGDGPAPAALPLQFRDFSSWQSQWLDEKAEELQAVWTRKLGDALPVLDVPADFTRPPVKTYAGARHTFVLDGEARQGLSRLSGDNGATLFMGLVAAVNVLLYRYTGATDIILGTPVDLRDDADLEEQIGFYLNTLAIRTRFDGTYAFSDLLNQVKRELIEAYSYQKYPFDRLVEHLQLSRDVSRSPLFDVMVSFRSEETVPDDGPADLLGTPFRLEATFSKFDLTFSFIDGDGQLSVAIEYNTDLFSGSRIARMAGHLQHLVAGLVAEPGAPVDRVHYLAPAEAERLMAYARGPVAAEAPAPAVAQLFERTAPGALAVTYQDSALTYRELGRQSNQAAFYLGARYGVGPGDRVGVMLDRSDKLVVTLLSILKRGAAFVLIDPQNPLPRQHYMLTDAAVKVLVTEGAGSAGYPCPVMDWHAEGTDVAAGPDQPADPAVQAPGLAYIIYTSGSTGHPKGVMVGWKSFLNYLAWADRYYFPDRGRKVFGLCTNPAFDLTLTSIFLPLLRGDQLAIFGEGAPDTTLKAVFTGPQRVNVVKLTPTHVRFLENLPLDHTAVDTVILGGEAVKRRHAEILLRANPAVRIYNEYGPTEATVGCTAGPLPAAGEAITIGAPIANTEIYILDDRCRLLPEGVPGQLCIGGAGLALGYLNRPELTRAKFVDHPFAPGEKVYLTGDRACWLEGGKVLLQGRMDSQVKLNGYRLELAEITQAVAAAAGVDDAVVVKRENDAGYPYLHCFVKPGAGFDLARVKEHVQHSLPGYMHPAQYSVVPAFTLTKNGKLDVDALVSGAATEAMDDGDGGQAASAHEAAIAQLWQQVLQTPRVGPADNFFASGGSSLQAIGLVGLLNKKFRTQLGLTDIYRYQTVREQARVVAARGEEQPLLLELKRSSKGGSPNVFFIPPILGSSALYKKLFGLLTCEANFYGIQYKGFDYDTAFDESVAAMADRFENEILRVQPGGRFLIAAFSMGAKIAFEIAKRLEQKGFATQLILMESQTVNDARDAETSRAAYASEMDHLLALHKLEDLERVKRLVLHNAGLMSRYELTGCIKGTIVAIEGQDSLQHNGGISMASWASFTEGGFSHIITKGAHHEIFEEEYLPEMANEFERVFNQLMRDHPAAPAPAMVASLSPGLYA